MWRSHRGSCGKAIGIWFLWTQATLSHRIVDNMKLSQTLETLLSCVWIFKATFIWNQKIPLEDQFHVANFWWCRSFRWCPATIIRTKAGEKRLPWNVAWEYSYWRYINNFIMLHTSSGIASSAFDWDMKQMTGCNMTVSLFHINKHYHHAIYTLSNGFRRTLVTIYPKRMSKKSHQMHILGHKCYSFAMERTFLSTISFS